MGFELPELEYAYDALEPHIDALTMEIHHSKHHAGYTANLNAAIVGTENGTEVLFNGEEFTVSCAEGDVGKIYRGIIPFKLKKTKLENLPQTKTPIMLNVASPELAFKFAQIPNAGVGLAREEFIINNYIQAHPLALLKHKKLKDPELTENIKSLTRGFKNEETFFVKRLSYGIAKIASAF